VAVEEVFCKSVLLQTWCCIIDLAPVVQGMFSGMK